MQIHYFYDLPLPSPFAAFIQILHTCRALSEQGVGVTVYTGPLEAASPEAALRHYGLVPHERLQIRPVFDGTRDEKHRIRRALEAAPPTDQRVVLSRGESSLKLFAYLRARPRQTCERYVYEAHRLSYEHALERGPSGSSVVHRLLHRAYVARMKAREARMVQRADALICLTQGVRDALQADFAPRAPTLILPSGTHIPEDEPPGDTERDLDILYAGKLVERKGVYDLVAAMRFLPEYRLCLVGGRDPHMRAVMQVAERLGVARQLQVTGYVEPAQVGAFYRRARVGVCPLPVGVSQIAELFTSPLKILDMMAYATPIVATDLPSVRELITDGTTAVLAPPSRPEALAQAIRRLLENREEAQRLARAAREAVQQYAWTNRAYRLRTFLEEVP